MASTITYNGGYKYQLREDFVVDIPLQQVRDIRTDYIELTPQGRLTIRKGYAWDGPSGPTIDTRNFMRGSLVHDALYQLMRERHLNLDQHRQPADRILELMCREDGMWWLRAWWVYLGVHYFGRPAADPSDKRPPTVAPRA
ncbi:MAG: hypothetical protein RL722_1614 [Pseudomonadota bacterium]|jgi:hypothetical protein